MSAVKYRTMHFHMHLLPTYFADKNSPWDVYYREVLEQVQLAEELGWDCFWFTEHHFLPYGGGIPNPAVMLSGVAARTSRIRLRRVIQLGGAPRLQHHDRGARHPAGALSREHQCLAGGPQGRRPRPSGKALQAACPLLCG